MKRICLFAGYSNYGKIEDYVIYYLKKLSDISDVYYLADCNISENELSKIDDIVVKKYAYKHSKYDFGSWQELINKIGYDIISQYDELILCNDSCFGPLYSLPNIFEEMNKKDYKLKKKNNKKQTVCAVCLVDRFPDTNAWHPAKAEGKKTKIPQLRFLQKSIPLFHFAR